MQIQHIYGSEGIWHAENLHDQDAPLWLFRVEYTSRLTVCSRFNYVSSDYMITWACCFDGIHHLTPVARVPCFPSSWPLQTQQMDYPLYWKKGFPLLTPQCFSPHLSSLRVLLPFLRFLNGWSIKSHSKTFKAFIPWTLWHRKTCFMSFKISPLDSDVNIFYLKSEHCCQFIIVGFLTFRSNFLFRRSIESHELLWIHIPAFAATREWLYYIHTKNIYVNNKLLLLLL